MKIPKDFYGSANEAKMTAASGSEGSATALAVGRDGGPGEWPTANTPPRTPRSGTRAAAKDVIRYPEVSENPKTPELSLL